MQQNFSLAALNTFHLDAKAKWFSQFRDKQKLVSFLKNELRDYPHFFILGGGSNVLFAGDFEGLVIHVDIRGKQIEHEDEDEVHLRVMAGEDWDDIVAYTVRQGWGGLENLSLIPGRVGASPIQNIGAYGAEAKDSIMEVEYFNITEQKLFTLNNEECRFAYRNSIFKNELKGKAVILSVLYRLQKKPVLNYEYKTLQQELELIKTIDLEVVRNAVIKVRKSRLPDPDELGNAGSFFKNPVISVNHYQKLLSAYKSLPGYKTDNDLIKVPAAYLIDTCNWKGKRMGNVGVHKNQPLVLVHFGQGNGNEILALADAIKTSVKKTFDIELEMEVNVV